MEISAEAINTLINYGKQLAGPQTVPGGNVPYVVTAGGKPEAMADLIYNQHAERPERTKAVVKVLDMESFIKYWTDFANPDSRCFANEPTTSLEGIIDYHEAQTHQPRWCQHRVRLTLQLSEEWQAWTEKNNTAFTQQAFAEFLEQHSMDIQEPAPADMMEVARDLSASINGEFGQAQRMQDGSVKFKWTETVDAKVGSSGQISVPDHFVLNIPVFVGGPKLKLPALFRFRVKEGKLIMFFTLVRHEEVRRQSFIMIRDGIEESLDIKILNGLPE